jgi:hypothetical protein
MNFAFPQQEVLKAVFQGLASPLDGCMPNIYPGFVGGLADYTYNLDKAKELMAKAGVSGIKTTLAYNAGDPIQEPIAITYLALGVVLVGLAVMEGFSAAHGYSETAVCRDLGQAQLACVSGVEPSCAFLKDRKDPPR